MIASGPFWYSVLAHKLGLPEASQIIFLTSLDTFLDGLEDGLDIVTLIFFIFGFQIAALICLEKCPRSVPGMSGVRPGNFYRAFKDPAGIFDVRNEDL